MKATLTWWDLVVSLNEAADAQELRSHIYNLWKKKGQLGQQHLSPRTGVGVRGQGETVLLPPGLLEPDTNSQEPKIIVKHEKDP